MTDDQTFQPNPTPVTPPSTPPQRKRRSSMNPIAMVLLVSAAFFVLFLVVSTAAFFWRGHGGSGGSGSRKSSAMALFGGGSVGVIELNGVILDSKKMLKRLEDFEENDEIKAVVLRINSPGGAVAPSQEIYQAVKNFKKPVVASMGSIAASGGYYVAMGAKKVYANPGTITGSIGVIMEFANLEKLYDWAKIQRYSIKTGKFKDVGAEYKPMSPEDKALLQGMVDDVLVQFKQAVADGRKMKMSEVDLIADGRIFSGSQAKKAGLVDDTATLHDVIKIAAKMGGIKDEKPNVIYPESRGRFLMELLNDGKDDGSDSKSPLSEMLSGLSRAVTGSAPVTLLQPGVYWLWAGGK